MRGKVYLVGAGPGDPELLTQKALRLLGAADVVLHDELVSTEILNLIPPEARVVNVGKRCGRKRISQEETNALLVSYAREGVTVVRLKGGDPLVFGRAGEEMDALRDAGMAFEVVPGVTAAFAAAAAAQVALTDRRSASRLTFLTAHRCAEGKLTDERERCREETLVLYMPGHECGDVATELRAAGWSRQTPCLLISRATLPEQQIYRTTLEELPTAPRLAAPAILIVGAVAAERRSPGQGESEGILAAIAQMGSAGGQIPLWSASETHSRRRE